MGLDAALLTLQGLVESACNGAGIAAPALAYRGWPQADDLTKVLNQGAYMVSLFPVPSSTKNASRWINPRRIAPSVASSVTVSVAGNVITFAGTSAAGLNIIAITDSLWPPAQIQTIGTDTLSSIAANLATQINTLGRASATASGPQVTVTGARRLLCNIGASGTIKLEAGRESTSVQVSAWCPTHELRVSVGDALRQNIGTIQNGFASNADSTRTRVRYRTGPTWQDDATSDYGVFEAHLFYDLEYGIYQATIGTQVVVFQTTSTPGTTTAVG